MAKKSSVRKSQSKKNLRLKVVKVRSHVRSKPR